MRLTTAVGEFGQLDLWRLAGKRSYERGERYVDSVSDLRWTSNGVWATVHGTEPYRVRLSWAGPLAGACSCPYGADGNFCKHCVAVGLAWLDGADSESAGGDGAAMPAPDELLEYLESLDHGTLVELLYSYATLDESLAYVLSVRARNGES
jgi:uncharacterized Zn finger protein